ncbi:MAG: DsrE family protein [Nitrospinota bacterium]|nr:DsrE family protein [Nitrospinota bacterium]
MSQAVSKILFIVTTSDEETFRASMLNASNLLASDVPVKFFISQQACHFFTRKYHASAPDGEVTVKGRLLGALKLGAEIIVCRTAINNYGIKPEEIIDGVDPSKGWMDIVDDHLDPGIKVIWVG